MDSELTSIASVKALNQGVASSDSPAFANLSATSVNVAGLVSLTGTRGTFIDSSENSTIPHIFATNDGVGDFSQEAGHLIIQPRVHTSVYRDIIFAGGTTNAKRLVTMQGEGDISFYNAAGTDAKLSWDASGESLSIGTTGSGTDRRFQISSTNPSTATTQYGIVANPTMSNDVTGSIYNIYSQANVASGASLTNLYSVYIGASGLNSSTVTNLYGLYQAGASEKNYFAGNVGIGTTTPSVNLEVIDPVSGNFAGAITVGGNGSNRRLILEQTDVLTYRMGGTGTNSITQLVSGGSAGAGTVGLTLDASSNVGIGTSTPHGKLQFASDINTRKIVLYEGGNNNYQFYGFGVESQTLVYSTYQPTDDHVFFSGASSTSRNELMRITGDGKVGIGTASPDVTLDISTATANTNGIVRIQNNMQNDYEALRIHSVGNYDAQMSFLAQGTSTYWGGFGIDYSDAGKFKLQTDNLFVGGSNLMTWARDGKVGIGTTAPDYKLSIHGGSTSVATGPHIQATTTDDSYPVFQQLNWSHDNVSLNFDSYFDGTWRSSDAGSNFQIYKLSDKFKIRYDSGIAAGSAVTWNEGFVMDTSGSVGIGTESPSAQVHIYTSGGDPRNIGLQNSERYWKMQTDGGLLTFNDVSAGDLARMTLDTGGDVGIGTGTTSPAARLEIKDNASNNYSTQMRFSQGYSTSVYSTIGSNFGGAMTINAGQGSTTANLNFSLNGTNRMKIDVNGRVTMPYQPAFKAAWGSRAATGSGRILSTNSSDTLATGRDEFNTGSHFSTATGKFTAPVAGTYVLGFQAMRHGNNGASLECRIKKNGGAMWARAYQGAFDQAHQYWSIVTTTKCAAGDYFQVYIGPSTSIYDDDTYFYGHLIG